MILKMLFRLSCSCSPIKIITRAMSAEGMSKNVPYITKTQISKNLELREVGRVVPGKPLVLLFDWLYAKPKALYRYSYMYHQRGLDVLIIRGELLHFLWPAKSCVLADEVFSYLLDTRDSQKYLVHAFSVGAYNYSVMMMMAKRDPGKYRQFLQRVNGQIFDSVTIGDLNNMINGIFSFFPENQFIQTISRKLINLYFEATKDKTLQVYNFLVHLFKNDPLVVPTLVYYAKNDPMCHVPSIEEMLKIWRQIEHFDITTKYWEKSVHCAHLKFHRTAYLNVWTEFMDKVEA